MNRRSPIPGDVYAAAWLMLCAAGPPSLAAIARMTTWLANMGVDYFDPTSRGMALACVGHAAEHGWLRECTS